MERERGDGSNANRFMTSQEACAPGWGTPMNGERTVITDDDSGLVVRFLRGDASAFDTLFLKYQDYVYNIIYGVIGSAEESRDLTQDVFLQVYRSLPRFRQGARFATWLYRIALNRAVDAARGAKRWRFLPLLDNPGLANCATDAETEPEGVFARGMEREAVQKILQCCPLSHRDVLVLRYYQDLSLEEISEVLGCTLAAAKVRLHRARKVFKDNYVAAFGLDTADPRETEDADAIQSTR
jgi:RNA polymerase sigma-70 factor (ECF subfamily)